MTNMGMKTCESSIYIYIYVVAIIELFDIRIAVGLILENVSSGDLLLQ